VTCNIILIHKAKPCMTSSKRISLVIEEASFWKTHLNCIRKTPRSHRDCEPTDATAVPPPHTQTRHHFRIIAYSPRTSFEAIGLQLPQLKSVTSHDSFPVLPIVCKAWHPAFSETLFWVTPCDDIFVILLQHPSQYDATSLSGLKNIPFI
jgi:hypothetical protein